MKDPFVPRGKRLPEELDFTCSLYLGLRHSSSVLGPFDALTSGRPSALREAPELEAAAAALARLVGAERGLLIPSSLHLFWDLFTVLGRRRITWHCDDRMYPIAEWGVQRSRCAGAPACSFPHHDADWLRWQLSAFQVRGHRPAVVTDGYCPGCQRFAPLADYLACVRARGGLLIIDDTQALGLFGRGLGPSDPFGSGGAGSLAALGLELGNDVLIGSSLAKAFGVPAAAVMGPAALVRELEAASETRVHCSPPSLVVARALMHALAVNSERGDALRQRLSRSIRHLQGAFAAFGLDLGTQVFPLQSLSGMSGRRAREAHGRLEREGLRAVLHRPRCDELAARLGFLVTAVHDLRQLERAALRVSRVCQEVTAASCVAFG
jgi:8-amino-7-oxononanoate synthase